MWGKIDKLCTNIWIYHYDIYPAPLLSLKGRDIDHFPKLF